mgnify:CR=1 FL=1
MSISSDGAESRVRRVKDKKKLIRHYRVIPYSELVEILRQDGEAFFEDSAEHRLKRQTVWKAARRLSELLGKRVVAQRALLRLGSDEALEGYSFAVEEQ